jgi:phosphatidate phosphatase PAH1
VNGEPVPDLTLVVQSGELYFSPDVARKKVPMRSSGSSREQIPITEVDEKDLAFQEGETTPRLHRMIQEEEHQIEQEIAEEKMMLGNSPSFSNHKAFQELKNSRNGTPLTPRKSTSFEKLNSALKGWFAKEKEKEKEKEGLQMRDTNGKDPNSSSPPKEKEVLTCKTPTPEQLAHMKLKEGANDIKFITSITKQVATAKIYLWPRNVKIIVSDIDGTITKTDKRGLFYYKFGYDWTHENVVELYKALAESGYYFVYLTARSVKVQGATRSYLDKIGVPKSPIFSAPHDLFGCVTTELWQTTAQGKMLHLDALRGLFSGDDNPLVAGFGNKVHDHYCYQKIGIEANRIYIINKSSEISVNGCKTSYEIIKKTAEKVFPNLTMLTAAIKHQDIDTIGDEHLVCI